MIDINVDQEVVNTMLEKAINERVDEIVKQKYFLTYTELANYLNISKPVIENLMIKNGLQYYKVGTKYLFKQADVDEFLDDITANMNAKNNDFKFFAKFQNGEDTNV
ncbi:helix-turn-helix domain-containing protein [Gracilibacillus saliphilus]|uniref:helix-turn-helix domain-containing protein n=1 Tax=Gracilibacillus saliphilus TaxID=543890 RepID=UPI0013CFED12|nr:helix-turn-helix domain-containing protein [Gracilibacillus saliphilus]